MRALLVAAILATAIFAGCFGKDKGHDHETFQCPSGGPLLDSEDFPDHDNASFNLSAQCPKKNGTNSTTNSTSRAPNVLPTLVFKSKDDAGNQTNSTLKGGNLTFDATGSFDPDGNITGLAMTVTDSNQTRTATLYDPATKSFTPRTFVFDRSGKSNITVAMVDDRGGFTTLNTQAFVDDAQILAPASFQGAFPAALSGDPPCRGPSEDSTGEVLPDTPYFKFMPFSVVDDAAWIEAFSPAGSITFTICSPDPDGPEGSAAPAAISPTGTNRDVIITNDGVALPAAKGVVSYGIGVYNNVPSPSGVQMTVIVHYGPRPATAST